MSGSCPVIVVDVDNMRHVCMKIYDVSELGCNIVGNKDQVANLSSSVYLVIKDVSCLVLGQIVWRENERAEVLFDGKSALAAERRAETRIDVSFPAVITDALSNESRDCVVCNASKSGCRVAVDNGFNLSDDVVLFVKAFGREMPGRIVWRTESHIGIQFSWAAA